MHEEPLSKRWIATYHPRLTADLAARFGDEPPRIANFAVSVGVNDGQETLTMSALLDAGGPDFLTASGTVGNVDKIEAAYDALLAECIRLLGGGREA